MADNIVKYILDIKSKNASSALNEVSKDANKASKSIDNIGNSSIKSTSKMKKLGNISLIAKASMLQLAEAAFKAVSALAGAPQAVADLVNNLNDLSARSGLSAQQIQGLETAFKGSGQEANAAASFITRFPRLLSEIEMGTTDAAKAFDGLGLSLKNDVGELRDADDIFRDIVSRITSIEDPTLRASTAARLLGRDAGKMLQAFANLESLDAFTEFAREFGVDTGPQASKMAMQFQHTMSLLETTLKGAAVTLGTAFGPNALEKIMKGLLKIIAFYTEIFRTLIANISHMFSKAMNNVQMVINTSIKGILMATKDFGINKLIGITDTAMNDMIGSYAKQIDSIAKTSRTLKREALDLPSLSGIFVRATEQSNKMGKAFDTVMEKLGKNIEKNGEGIEEDLLETAPEFDKNWSKSFKSFEEGFTGAFDGLEDAMMSLDQFFDNLLARIEETFAKTAGLISAIASGDIVGGVQQFTGPIGTAVVGTFGAVSDLGQRIEEEGGTEFIKLDIENFVRGFVIGLSHLPAILIEVLPPLLFEAAGRIVIAIIQLPFHIAKAVKDAVKGLGDVIDERRQRRQEEGFGANTRRNASRLAEALVSGVMMGGGSFIPKAANGMRFTGNRRGLAMLHEGEFVVPQSGRQSQAVMRQMGQSGGVNIVINADVVERNAIDELVRRIERRFDLFGTSTSPLFAQG